MATNVIQYNTHLDTGDWHPRYWTIACVGTVHLFFAAAVLTSVQPPVPPPTINVVDIVTFPNARPQDSNAPPVELKREDALARPKPIIDPRFGPKPTDRRVPPLSEPQLSNPKLEAPNDPEPLLLPPAQPIAQFTPPEPLSVPVVAPKPVIVPPLPAPLLKTSPQPAQVSDPIPEPSVEVVPLRTAPSAPSLTQPPADPLSISGAKLKLKQAQTIKPIETPKLAPPATPVATPPAPTPSPVLPAVATPSVATVQPAAARPLSPPPPFTSPAPAPLTINRSQAPLPKVQVPRIRATDLRLPDDQIPPAVGAPAMSANPPATSGVTSLSPTPSGSGQSGSGANSPAASGPSGQAGASSSGSGGTQGGQPAGGGPPLGQVGGGGGTSGPTGILPRRPGGPAVRQPFPRGEGNTLLNRMDKTYDCSRINRERDARCPDWGPIEGRNGRPTSSFEVPVPKGLPTLRNPFGTNPLPPCPPGTPGSQMGLSCLPTREGPGIPKQ